MKIGGATLNQTPLDWKNNINNIKGAILQAEEAGIDLLCLPELALTGYGCQDVFLSEWIYERALEELEQFSSLCKKTAFNIGLPILSNNIRYNCVAFFAEGHLKGISAKQHLANDGVHYEKRWFTPWPSKKKSTIKINNAAVPFGDLIYNFRNKNIGFEICEDAWSETRPATHLASQNVDYILNPSASHFAFGKSKLREQLVASSSEKFNCTYIYSNLLGNEAGRMIYDGEILIARAGKIVSKNTLCSFKKVNILTENHSPIKGYSKNEEFLLATRLGLYDYMRKAFAKGYVLSLSGGADSGTCAVLVSEMLKTAFSELSLDEIKEDSSYLKDAITSGKDSYESLFPEVLRCAYQATENSGPITHHAAEVLAKSLHSKFYHWSINDMVTNSVETVERVLDRKLNWATDDLALQNIQARSRSPIIWMLTNLTGGLLLTTSNRSEGGMGYTTMDGDTSGGLAPIAGVDKHFVRQWLVWAEKKLGYEALKLVNEQAPTAELRPTENVQTDEQDLMPYDLMVAIEKAAIREYQSPQEVFNSLKKKEYCTEESLKIYINKFFHLWRINQWKRERIAPCFHLDDFNVDPKTWYRFPILSGSYEQL